MNRRSFLSLALFSPLVKFHKVNIFRINRDNGLGQEYGVHSSEKILGIKVTSYTGNYTPLSYVISEIAPQFWGLKFPYYQEDFRSFEKDNIKFKVYVLLDSGEDVFVGEIKNGKMFL